MAPRPVWKGYLKLSLVALPVRAYVASGDESTPVRFNQLHRDCHSRIRYQKVCPIHGEVSNDEVVSGYEYAKGQYVEIDPDDLAALRPEGERGITVEAFVHPDAVDPSYLNGKTYYVLPDGAVGQKPYQLVREAMESEGVHAIARMLITTREHMVRLRPVDGLLAVDLLDYAGTVRTPADFREDLVESKSSAQEQKLARQLVSSMIDDKLDFSQFTDDYTDRVRQLIEAKVEGKEIVAPAESPAPPVINLMDALKKSLGRGKPGKAAQKPPRRKAASLTKRVAVEKHRRRKSG